MTGTPLPRVVADDPRVAVFVEGGSDAVVVDALGRARGIRFGTLITAGGSGAALVSMRGVTNARRELARLRTAHPTTLALGLADAPEERIVATALSDHGLAVADRTELARAGFFVCEDDLEDELIRALGPEAILEALGELGELGRFARFQRQPEWRGRPIVDQLHRFAGSGAGRKLALAERLAARLDASNTPRPLVLLLDRVERALT